MSFSFATATRIVFGAGSLAQLGKLCAGRGARALVVLGAARRRADQVESLLGADASIACTSASVDGEPRVERIRSLVEQARAERCDLVVGLGGGSAIDAAKAVSALLANPGDPLDYLEVIGRGQPLAKPAVPFVAVPTTSGTGAEVTKNAVLHSTEHSVKVSLRSDSMLPALALVDPELTLSLPPAITATTSLDALTQCLEPFVSQLSNPLTDAIALEGLKRAGSAVRRAFHHGGDIEGRTGMALVSLFGGLALANAKLGAVHGFAGPIGGMFPAPHGGVCARLLPAVMRANVAALRERAPQSPALPRYQTVARVLTGNGQASIEDGVQWLERLVEELAIPPLSRYGLSESRIPDVLPKARAASSMRGNPIELTDDELSRALCEAI